MEGKRNEREDGSSRDRKKWVCILKIKPSVVEISRLTNCCVAQDEEVTLTKMSSTLSCLLLSSAPKMLLLESSSSDSSNKNSFERSATSVEVMSESSSSRNKLVIEKFVDNDFIIVNVASKMINISERIMRIFEILLGCC